MTTNDDAMENRAYLALADHFLDTETRHLLPRTALSCIEAGWDLKRAEKAYFDEMAPLVWTNMLATAGVWEGWNEPWLLEQVRSRRDRAARCVDTTTGFLRRSLPYVSAVWASLERFMVRIERAAPAQQKALAEALEDVGRVYFDFLPSEPTAIEPSGPGPREEDLWPDFRESVAPLTSARDRKVGERNFEARVAKRRNRESSGIDISPLLTGPSAWRTVCGLSFDLPSEVSDDLVHAYRTGLRAYHDLSHIVEVLRHLERAPLVDRVAPTLAVLFHDAVYEPERRDNEARSAAFAESVLGTTSFAIHVPRVKELILLTAHHGSIREAEVDPDAELVLDADMAILGAPPQRFDAYERAIAAEYAAVSPRLFRHGRSRFLEGLLAREHIFLTEFFRKEHEATARTNIERALSGSGLWP